MGVSLFQCMIRTQRQHHHIPDICYFFYTGSIFAEMENVQILQIYLCYFSLAVLIFWLNTRKLAKDIVLLALC